MFQADSFFWEQFCGFLRDSPSETCHCWSLDTSWLFSTSFSAPGFQRITVQLGAITPPSVLLGKKSSSRLQVSSLIHPQSTGSFLIHRRYVPCRRCHAAINNCGLLPKQSCLLSTAASSQSSYSFLYSPYALLTSGTPIKLSKWSPPSSAWGEGESHPPLCPGQWKKHRVSNNSLQYIPFTPLFF